jgi:hypothetical protein
MISGDHNISGGRANLTRTATCPWQRSVAAAHISRSIGELSEGVFRMDYKLETTVNSSARLSNPSIWSGSFTTFPPPGNAARRPQVTSIHPTSSAT